jgi:hypothetical protein
MSPPVIMLPVRNFKFRIEGSFERRRNYQFREKALFACGTGFRSAFVRLGNEWIPAL